MAKRKTFKQPSEAPIFVMGPTLVRDEVIPPGSQGRVIDNFVNRLDLAEVLDTYKGGGTSAYHPKGLLKVILLAYVNNIYGSRPIAEMVRYDLRCWFFTQGLTPSHNTVNRFRTNRLGEGGVLKIFHQLLEMLVGEGLVSFEETYVDGTTVEARASRTRIVWQQSVRRHAQMNRDQIQRIVDQAKQCEREEYDAQVSEGQQNAGQENAGQENAGNGDTTGGSRSENTDTAGDRRKARRTEDVHPSREFLDEIRGSMDEMPLGEKERRELRRRLDRAEELRARDRMCGSRSGVPTTDPESVAMHPKDDPMHKGPCRPMYNAMFITASQFILDYYLAGLTTDMAAFPLMLGHIGNRYTGSRMGGDAGFGSYLNILLALQAGIIPYFKYSMFDKEQQPRYTPNRYDGSSFPYDSALNAIRCPAGQPLRAVRTATRENYGITTTLTTFRTDGCAGCPLRQQCHRGSPKDYREVELNLDWWLRVKPATDRMLTSDTGKEMLQRRSMDVEPVNSHLKWAGKYGRFRHFGKSKCTMDLGLRCLAQNLKHYLAVVTDILSTKAQSLNIALEAAFSGLSGHFTPSRSSRLTICR